ncbi:arginase [Paenibacillus sp. HJGM_3]|uniref:arginase n=1 Tax=Paenibacillus sp. HJGM_3 TaxID=3379816 RepID=UPI00385D9A62
MPYVGTVETIRVPFDLGAGRRGASLGPGAIMRAGLECRLQQLNVPMLDRGDIPVPGHIPFATPDASLSAASSTLRYLAEVEQVNAALAESVAQAAAGKRFPLVLGGDHSIAIGTIAGLADHYRNLGVIWFDAHSDLNTEHSTPSGNIHGMSLAVSLGLGHPALTGIRGDSPKIKPEHIVLIGVRSLDPAEKTFIRSQGITCYTMHDIDRKGIGRVMEEAMERVSTGTDGVHLSFDVDCLDPLEAPGTGTAVNGGLSFREAHLALELLYEAGIVTSAEFVEVNPALDVNEKTAHLAVGLICSLLGQQIL